MKRNFFDTFCLAILLTLLTSASVLAIPTANLNLLNPPSVVGDTFNVEVWADGDGTGNALLSFGFDVSMDHGGVFDYSGYALGPGFDDDSAGGGNVAGSAFPSILDDEVLLATLSFTTLAPGTDTINVMGLYDGMFSGMYYEIIDGLTGYDIICSLDVNVDAAPVPEPCTLALIGVGLLGLTGVSRRSKN